MGVGGQRNAPAALPSGMTGTHVQEAEWAPRPVWTCAEYLAHAGIESPRRPTRSESLYRLSYPSP